MRTWFSLTLCAALLLGADMAHAQFANRSLGLSAGYLNLDNSDSGVENGIPIGLHSTLYMENGFDLTFNFQLMILKERVQDRQVVGIAPSTGIRYLFAEEDIRPYAGVDLSFLYIFGVVATQGFVGLGPNAGLEFFVSDSVSLGVRAQFNVYLALNAPVQTSIGGLGLISTYF